MTWVVHLLVSVLIVLGSAWLVVFVALFVCARRGPSAGGAFQLLFEILRLLRKLAREPSLPRTVRWRLYLALAYNVQPFNLIPDFSPVVGLADNVIITWWALRSALRHAGPDTVASHWAGSSAGLASVYRIAGLKPPQGPPAQESWCEVPSTGTSELVVHASTVQTSYVDPIVGDHE